jgi:hypothetical protein
MDKYCEIVDVENLITRSINSSFESQIDIWIKGVTKMMDTMANRKLVAREIQEYEAPDVKYYDGNNSNYLLIDDCQSISELSISDTFGDQTTIIDPVDYALTPKIAPHKAIALRGDVFTDGMQNITVKGEFGLFSELPDDIKFACSVIVAGIINNQDKGNSEKKSESIGNYSVTYLDPQGFSTFEGALNIIKSYRKQTY